MKLLICVIALLAVLGGLFVIFKPQSSPASMDVDRAPAVPATHDISDRTPPQGDKAATSRDPMIFELVVRGGRLVSGPTVIQVRDGDDVTLHITTDTPDELHIHGYDIRAKTQPGAMVTLHFVAQRTGHFAIELHNLDQEIGAIEVYPR